MARVETALLMRAASALRDEARRQQARKVADLDYDALARAALQAMNSEPAKSPIDPEGDGLETRELNAANDV